MIVLHHFREPFINIKEWGWSNDQNREEDPVWAVLPKAF